MKQRIMEKLISNGLRFRQKLKEENGETNIIAIILIIIVVIGLVGIFRTQLTSIVTGLFNQIKESLGL